MSLDNLVERFVAAHERIADALENLAVGSARAVPPSAATTTVAAADAGEAVRKRGRPRKEVTVDPVPTQEPEPESEPAVVAPTPTTSVVTTKDALATQPTKTVEELQKLVGWVCSKGKAGDVKAVFAEYGVERASAIPAGVRDAAFGKIRALVPAE